MNEWMNNSNHTKANGMSKSGTQIEFETLVHLIKIKWN